MSSGELQEEYEEFEKDSPARKKFDLGEFLENNKVSVILALIGLILVGFGVIIYKDNSLSGSDKVEVLNSATQGQEEDSEIVVEIGGAVKTPGVYKLKNGDRIEDLLVAAGGLSEDADIDWVGKYINRAAKLSDGQKLYVFSANEQSDDVSARNSAAVSKSSDVLGSSVQGLVNINTSDFKTLDSLPGIGQVYGQSIIEHRPYSNTEELVSKDVVPQSTFEKIKDMITVY